MATSKPRGVAAGGATAYLGGATAYLVVGNWQNTATSSQLSWDLGWAWQHGFVYVPRGGGWQVAEPMGRLELPHYSYLSPAKLGFGLSLTKLKICSFHPVRKCKKVIIGPPFGSFSREIWKLLIFCQKDQYIETIIGPKEMPILVGGGASAPN